MGGTPPEGRATYSKAQCFARASGGKSPRQKNLFGFRGLSTIPTAIRALKRASVLRLSGAGLIGGFGSRRLADRRIVWGGPGPAPENAGQGKTR